MTRERFYNSATQPSGPDCLVASAFTSGGSTLVVDGLPTFIGIAGFSAGDQFHIKVEDTLYLVTGLGAGNVHWAVTVAEGSADANHIVGTGVYLVLTSGAIKDGIRNLDAITATDQTANGWPNSVPLSSVSAADLADAVATTDTRLSNARTPTAHQASHHKGGSDALPVESQYTAETDTTKVLAPDGANGLAFRAETGGGSSTFAGLTDVLITSPALGDVPIWNPTSMKWENGPQTGGGGGGGGGGTSSYINIQDQKSTGTDGGSVTSGAWRTCVLNTIVKDPDNVVTSLISNQVGLPAGTYRIHASRPVLAVDGAMIRWRNITDSSTAVVGQHAFGAGSGVGGFAGANPSLEGMFIIAGAKTFELQVQVSTTNGNSFALGQATNWEAFEVYSTVVLEKVA